MKFDAGYCSFECNACTQVCPNGAILPLTLDEKQHLSIGLATVHEHRCVAFQNNEACGACAEVCPVTAVHMTDSPKGTEFASVPHMKPEICLGCGACENACPVAAITVEGRKIHRKITAPPPVFVAPAATTEKSSSPKIDDGFAF